MLLKPSTAETLVDLQAEFNSLKVAGSVKDESESTAEVGIDCGWPLTKYF
jgi:hypothetical protein